MTRATSIGKIIVTLGIVFWVMRAVSGNIIAATVITGGVSLYVWLGGYIELLKEGAVNSKSLPFSDQNRLDTVKAQLIQDVRHMNSVDISALRIYLVPGDDSRKITAYGANCISVARGALNNLDPVTLTAMIARETSHLLYCDAEFNRAVFMSTVLLIGLLSLASTTSLVFVFFFFLFLSFLSPLISLLAFRGITSVTKGFFRLFQTGIILLFRMILGLINRQAEYRCDNYACALGYGIQLCHYLSLSTASNQQHLTLAQALYRNYPPVEKRIAKLENQMTSR